MPQLHRRRRDQPRFRVAPQRRNRPHIHHCQPPAVDDGQAGADKLRQHNGGQILGVLQGQRARQRHGCGRADLRTGQRAKRQPQPRHLQNRAGVVGRKGQRANGGNADGHLRPIAKDDLQHLEQQARLVGRLHAGAVDRLGRVAHRFGKHDQGHRLGGDILRRVHRRHGGRVGQGIQQARAGSHVSAHGRARLATGPVQNVPRTAQVVNVQRAVAQSSVSAAALQRHCRRAGRQTAFHQLRRQADSSAVLACPVVQQQASRARVVEYDARLVQNAQRRFVDAVDLVGGQCCQHGWGVGCREWGMGRG